MVELAGNLRRLVDEATENIKASLKIVPPKKFDLAKLAAAEPANITHNPVYNRHPVLTNGAVSPAMPRVTTKHTGDVIGENAGGLAKLSDGSLIRNIAVSLAQGGTLHRSRIAALVGKSSNNGSFNSRLNELRRAGFVVCDSGNWTITQEGFAALGEYEELPTGDAFVELKMSQLAGLQLDIVAALHQHKAWLHRNDLATAVGKESNNGSFNARLGELRRVGLIECSNGQWRINSEIYA